MKRLAIEPAEEALFTSIGSNAAGRNEDIINFVRLLDSTEGPFTFMVDAPWGDGKTFFIKSVVMILEAMNPNIIEVDKSQPELKSVIDGLSDVGTPYLPFYFNAWDNDFADDPLCAMLACMAVVSTALTLR